MQQKLRASPYNYCIALSCQLQDHFLCQAQVCHFPHLRRYIGWIKQGIKIHIKGAIRLQRPEDMSDGSGSLLILSSRLFLVHAESPRHFTDDPTIDIQESILLCYNVADFRSSAAKLTRDRDNNFALWRYA